MFLRSGNWFFGWCMAISRFLMASGDIKLSCLFRHIVFFRDNVFLGVGCVIAWRQVAI